MPNTHRIYPSSGVPISHVPPAEVIQSLRLYRQGRNIPEAVRAEDMIEWLVGEVERLGGGAVAGSLFERNE